MKKPRRPDESELLAFLDEEQTPQRQAEIRQQLAADWELRAQLAKLERRVEQFVDATAAFQESDEQLPMDDLWRDFSDRLAATADRPVWQAQVATEWRLFLAQLSRWLQNEFRLRLMIGATACLLVLATLALLLWQAERSVSAQEFLHRTTQAEAASLRRVGDPVVYRKIHIKRSGTNESVLWESWNDAQRKQFRQRVADQQGLRFLRAPEKETPAVIAELEQIFRANHFDPQRPLSAAAFAEWRKAIKTKAETVSQLQDELRLTTIAQEPYSVNTITEASLIVRKSDWHVVALHLKVQGENEIRAYELNETAYEVLPLQALTVFADLAPTPLAMSSPLVSPTVVTALPVAAASPLPTPSVALPSAAALQEAEVAALFTLHQLQADLGEQIEVLRDANRQIIVRGLVETEARKQQLNEALRAVPLVVPNLQTVEAAAQQMAAKPVADAVETNTIATAEIAVSSAQTTSVNPFHQYLEKYFVERGNERRNAAMKAAQLSDTVVSETAAALSEAWALRRLAERFKPEQEDEFTAANRQRLTEMMRNHLARLQAQHRSLHAQLNPILSALAGTIAPPAVSSAGNRQAQALQLFKAVEQVAHLSNSLFAGTSGGAPEQAARRTLSALAQLDGALQSFEQTISK